MLFSPFAYYQNLRQGARRGINGARVAYEDLSARFPGGSHSKATPPAPHAA